ncbi:MAG: hypothetical protein AUI14_13325 [Actinobacteria bacterium 13_2_20CM_2_71_6]|nr:MAG: hypothetical protein AUI14_13325 [Actinobacteria bacterium 13_2_20CM_2_71_6]
MSRLVPLFAVAALGALLLALRAPLATTVLGLIAFGVLHNVLELRYVAGRFAGVLRGRFLLLLVVLVSGIVACRLAGARTPEIVLAYAVLAAGVVHAVRRPVWRAAALLGLAGAATASLTWPAYHFVILAHLHNVVPLVFLWEWARRLPTGRTPFRVAQLGWVLGVPALILAGVFDPFVAGGPSAVAAFAGPPAAVAAPVVPPGLTIGLRFLVVFAYLQTMHYVVWVGFLPRYAPEAARAFDARVRWLAGWRPWALGIGFAVLLAILFVADYRQGRLLYASFASYHAYLEFPVLLALLFGARHGSRHQEATAGITSRPMISSGVMS